ncbi:MAG: hypothetical protein ACKPKO_08920, partial [Candidatus Fonsibacter sp.]
IETFEELNKVCIFVYELDEESKIRLSKAGKIEYLTNDLVYLLRIDNRQKSHYIYIHKKDLTLFQPEHTEGRQRQNILSYMLSKREHNRIQRTPMHMLQICKGINMYQIARGGESYGI